MLKLIKCSKIVYTIKEPEERKILFNYQQKNRKIECWIAMENLKCVFFRQAVLSFLCVTISPIIIKKNREKVISCAIVHFDISVFQFFDQMPDSMLKTVVNLANLGQSRFRSRVMEKVSSDKKLECSFCRARYYFFQEFFHVIIELE